jgi:hypothetical protein
MTQEDKPQNAHFSCKRAQRFTGAMQFACFMLKVKESPRIIAFDSDHVYLRDDTYEYAVTFDSENILEITGFNGKLQD